jgi:two-component system chemotaxis response regulator CheB
MITSDPDLEVIATARDGQEAIDKIQQLRPDIVTMDIEMPRMDGLTALQIIMEKMPLPVIMVSSLTNADADATLKALDLGAVDFICKDLELGSMSIMEIEQLLIGKIKSIAGHKIKHYDAPSDARSRIVVPRISKPEPGRTQNIAVVTIGVSTGGPKALQDVIPFLPKDFLVPVLVVQHMPVQFTKSFAERLDSMSELDVKEAETGDLVEPGKVFIARGGVHMKVQRTRPFEVRIVLDPNPGNVLYHPSVDVMMFSALEVYGGRILGVIMTGMGNDGTEGLREIKYAGGKTLAQDEETCVVWGMPKCAFEAGVVDKVAPLQSLASEIVNMV